MPARLSAVEHLLLHEADARGQVVLLVALLGLGVRQRALEVVERGQQLGARRGACRRARPSATRWALCLRTFSTSAALRSARSFQSGSGSAPRRRRPRPAPPRRREVGGLGPPSDSSTAGSCSSTRCRARRSSPTGPRPRPRRRRRPPRAAAPSAGAPLVDGGALGRGLLLGALVHGLGDLVERGLQRLGLGVDLGGVLGGQRLADLLDRGLDLGPWTPRRPARRGP